MPLKAKRHSPRARTAKCNSSKVTAGSSQKVVSGKLHGKSTTGGKKPGKKPERAKAGYELYSSESDDCLTLERKPQQYKVSSSVTTLVEEWMARQDGDSPETENVPRGVAVQNMQGEEHLGCAADQVPFNRRLVSSTPDPQLVEEDEAVQLVPERDTEYRQAASSLPCVQPVTGIQNLQVQPQRMLTETQREHLRQQIDAVLLEEAQEAKRQQQHGNPPQSQQPQHPQLFEESPSTALFEEYNAASVDQREISSASLGKQRVAKNHSISQEENSAPVPTPQSTWRDIMSDNGLAARGSDIGVFHHFLHRESTLGLPPPFMTSGGRGDGDCQVFVPQITPGAAPNMSMGFVPVGEQTAAFNPLLSGADTTPRQNLSSTHRFHPLAVLTENVSSDQGDGATPRKALQADHVHSATPACSPVRQRSRETGFPGRSSQAARRTVQNTHRQEGKTKTSKNTPKTIPSSSGELQTPATSPEEPVSRLEQRAPLTSLKQNVQHRQQFATKSGVMGNLNSPGSRAIRGRAPQKSTEENASNNSSKTKRPKNAGKAVTVENEGSKPPMRDSSANYTSDGYYINGCVDSGNSGNDDDLAPEPRAFLPTPMHSPKVPATNLQDSLGLPVFETDQRELNKNNSSDTYPSQEADLGWMHMRRGAMARTPAARGDYGYRMPEFLNQVRPAREAMAEADFSSLPLGVAKAMMMMGEDGMDSDPATPAPTPVPTTFRSRDVLNGPRKLRHLLNELKEICAIDGDMEVGQLLQEIISLVEVMPQLKVTFNLQAEIDLALQPLRNENSQLRRRLRILNQQLKERERREKEDSNPGMNFEMLHLQTENASLQRQLKEEREGCKKLSQYITEQQQKLEKATKELQAIQYKFTEKEHDKLLARQEHSQDMSRLHQELEMMSRRNESVQLKLASADRENNILQLNLKQRDIEIARLHTILGNLKQGVTEVLQYFDQGVGDLNTTDNVMQKLLGFLKSSSQAYNPPKDDLSRSTDCEPLERSGNQRIARPHRPEKGDTQEDLVTDHKDMSRHGSSSSLTVSAVAAHNRHLEAVKDRTEKFARRENFSFHSWDGVDLKRSLVGNRSQLYHSDPESMASPHKNVATSNHLHYLRHQDHHRQKQQQFQKNQQHLQLSKPLDLNQSHHLSPKSAKAEGVNANDNWAETRSEDETLCTLSEIPISETDKEKAADPNDSQATDITRHSLTDYFKRYPSSKPVDARPKSPPRLSSSRLADDFAATALGLSPPSQKPKPKEKSPALPSPNSSVINSASDMTQKDFFHSTELDLSLSTIQEDALSTLTGSTLNSIATAMSLDDRAFRDGIATLDENIAKVHEALQRTKKMFS